MMVVGAALVLIGVWCVWIDNWIGYILAFCMAAGITLIAGSLVIRILDLLL